MATEKTVVVFRVWRKGGDVLALFPLEDGGRGLCMSYQHVGQHGAADYGLCIGRTRPATPAEYSDLAAELREIGYELRIVRRCPAARGAVA